jgi:hypothetical protein
MLYGAEMPRVIVYTFCSDKSRVSVRPLLRCLLLIPGRLYIVERSRRHLAVEKMPYELFL